MIRPRLRDVACKDSQVVYTDNDDETLGVRLLAARHRIGISNKSPFISLVVDTDFLSKIGFLSKIYFYSTKDYNKFQIFYFCLMDPDVSYRVTFPDSHNSQVIPLFHEGWSAPERP